ncbi:hypothetical protein FRB99_004639, partial [Tulasnella sp. 403]
SVTRNPVDGTTTPAMETQALPLPSPDILQHVVDVHCHPTDTDVSDGSMDDLKIKICAMSSRADDQPK